MFVVMPAITDQWRQMGLEGWAYKDVLPYFKRSESLEGGGGFLAWRRGAAEGLRGAYAESDL